MTEIGRHQLVEQTVPIKAKHVCPLRNKFGGAILQSENLHEACKFQNALWRTSKSINVLIFQLCQVSKKHCVSRTRPQGRQAATRAANIVLGSSQATLRQTAGNLC